MRSLLPVQLAFFHFLLLCITSPHGCKGGVTHSQPTDATTTTSTIPPGAYFRHKTVIIPHDSKKHRGGEDAAAASDTVLVVADGVGGWIKQNIDPGHYSRLLTQTIVELATWPTSASSSSSASEKEPSLIEIVHEANWKAASQHLGSATCTTLKLTGPSTLSTLNIGDSGYSIHRVGNYTNDNKQDKSPLQLLFMSEPGQKSFNYPYQIGGRYGDVVADVAVSNSHELEHGDIIVVYSDGVSDNMDPLEFHSCLGSYLKDDDEDDDEAEDDDLLFSSLSIVADCIARTAYELGKNKNFDSPFARGAREVGKRYIGGKHDDISVIVAQFFVGNPTGSNSGSSGTATKDDENEDPHYAEALYLYKGPVPPLTDLPDKNHLKRKAAASPKTEL